MKKLFYAAVILLLSHTVAAQSFSGQYDWVKFFAGYERDYYPSQGIYCTEVDDSGYVYYYGSFGDLCTQGLYGLEGRFERCTGKVSIMCLLPSTTRWATASGCAR